MCSYVAERGLCEGAASAPTLCLGTQYLTEATVPRWGGGGGAGLQEVWVQVCLRIQDGALLPRAQGTLGGESAQPVPRQSTELERHSPTPIVVLPSVLWKWLHFCCGTISPFLWVCVWGGMFPV